ncbi:putative ABC transporter ATP-binding protein YhcH [Cohnella xylanilytica]|uniref:ABC transporter ATP-binding protein n=1 Tax=Cohnella xylanilytica TaxID=557555 RepID=A0A841TZ59_9BACL|nr:ABC transporter ATP-binding protein [Cohnella xylanilytica]MBB6692839.1 ABC transporter ATP-binding protein [Cohnella xylanilytica]GIO10601.1 putative ABC transporter ATP-binding protein YhcH [Cohnella xylanilytica]
MSQAPVARLQNVTKRIGGRTIIDRVSLDVYPGEVFGFLGPNGSGKTTTIRMMVGLMSLTSGDISIGGHSVRTEYPRAAEQVGAIVENPEMYKFLTGYQNLVHFARMNSSVTKERIDEVVKLVGLSGRIHDKVKKYSLGMRQRLGVAQAVMHRPKLLILDEPTNGLDPAGIRELRDYLRQLAREEGISVFVSSHLLSEMELMCDRVAILQKGQIIDIRSIRGQAGEAVQQTEEALFDVDRPEAALGALQGEWSGYVADGRLVLSADRNAIAEANRRLVEAGIRVYGIRAKTKSLEDQFLEVTGSETND